MAINNVEPANAKFPSQSVVDEVRISDHQKDMDELILGPEAFFSVEPAQKIPVTWAKVKGDGL